MRFALEVLTEVDAFPRTTAAQIIGRQVARSATSVAANYRAACIARSRAEFVAKLGTVLEEADESEFWLDLATRKRLGSVSTLHRMRVESAELRAIFARSVATARANSRRQPTTRLSQSPINNQITR